MQFSLRREHGALLRVWSKLPPSDKEADRRAALTAAFECARSKASRRPECHENGRSDRRALVRSSNGGREPFRLRTCRIRQRTYAISRLRVWAERRLLGVLREGRASRRDSIHGAH